MFQAVDIYLGFCYLNVVFALIEYATVAYSKKKYEDRKKNKSKNIFELTPQLHAPDLLQGMLSKEIAAKLYTTNKLQFYRCSYR